MTARPLSSLAVLLLASLAFAASAGAATPGPNGRIAFVQIPPGSHNFEQLYSAAADGSDVKRLDWVDLSDESPAWSPDGTRLAFSRGNAGVAIWVMNSDGTGQTQVTSSGIGDIWPSWSPDGKQLAFASTRLTGTWNVWIVNVDGTGLHRLTSGSEQDTYSAWSPDGTRIAYSSAATGALWVVNVDGTGARQLTDPGADTFDEHPDWSPDGRSIVFSRRPLAGPGAAVYAIDADGTNERLLNAGYGPSYSPDGTKILFQGGGVLSVMNADGSGAAQLPNPLSVVTPAWGSETSSPVVTPPAAPAVHFYSPDPGQLMLPGQQVPAYYTCDSAVSIIASCVGTVPLLGLLDTSTAGEHVLSVTATDVDGRQTIRSISYTVIDLTPPTVDVRAPLDGAEYAVGEKVVVDYSCSDGPSGSGIAWCQGDLPLGAPVDTSHAGTFRFGVVALDNANHLTVVHVTYRVVDRIPPTVSISWPSDRTVFTLGSFFSPSYSCSDVGSGVASCVASTFDTSTIGPKIFTVTATDYAGNTASASKPYTVVYPFGFDASSVAYPGSNAARAGDAVHVRFSLSGDRGLGVVASAAWAPCAGGASTSAKTTLSYKTSSDAYDLKAFTSDTWTGSCLDLVVTLDDGTAHGVRFVFSR